ncbi:MAG TPA: HAMP domain-containing sensor histidine kinase [Marmoricola sp.]|nr:HAMP domain-containing sensor histidine kinase [Marmoricola sp.]
MRSRIAWLVVATTTAVVISFVVPLCLLVRTLAHDRAMAGADQEARNVAILASNFEDAEQLRGLVEAADRRGTARVSLVLDDGTVLGAAPPGLADDPDVLRARGGESAVVKDDRGGMVVLPVVVTDGTWVVVSRVTPDQLNDGVARAWISFVLLGLALIGLALLVANWLGRRISRPLVELSGTAHRLRSGDLSARADVSGPPETQDLAGAMNALAERISELLAAERAGVADLSHRLRTPVTALRLDAEAVQDPALVQRLQDRIDTLQRDIDAIVHEARRPVREDMASSCDAALVVAARVAYWRPLAEDQGRRLTEDLGDPPLLVRMAASDLRDVVDILLDNVFAHTDEGVAFSVTLQPTGDRVRLEVADSGRGMDEGAGPGRRPGSTGLGLDIVRRAVAGSGGTVNVDSSPADGTHVQIVLPLLRSGA